MSIHWEKLLTSPLGLAGYALFLVFSVITIVIKQRKPTNQWAAPTGFALAAICILGCLTIAYRHEQNSAEQSAKEADKQPPKQTPPNQPAQQSLTTGDIHQKADNGVAAAGVQGNITVNTTNPASQPTSQADKPKP